jgi:hypothetical protein
MESTLQLHVSFAGAQMVSPVRVPPPMRSVSSDADDEVAVVVSSAEPALPDVTTVDETKRAIKMAMIPIAEFLAGFAVSRGRMWVSVDDMSSMSIMDSADCDTFLTTKHTPMKEVTIHRKLLQRRHVRRIQKEREQLEKMLASCPSGRPDPSVSRSIETSSIAHHSSVRRQLFAEHTAPTEHTCKTRRRCYSQEEPPRLVHSSSVTDCAVHSPAMTTTLPCMSPMRPQKRLKRDS